MFRVVLILLMEIFSVLVFLWLILMCNCEVFFMFFGCILISFFFCMVIFSNMLWVLVSVVWFCLLIFLSWNLKLVVVFSFGMEGGLSGKMIVLCMLDKVF